MAVRGLVRLRKHQFGRQAAFGTKVAATRAYPITGVPSVDLQWTDQEVDAGSLYVTAPPYRQAPQLGLDAAFNALHYNDLPLILSGFFGGQVSPTPVGAAGFTWQYNPSPTGGDTFDPFTYEFGETDVTDDWFQLGDGVVESFEITGPDGLGALTASATWRFGSVANTGATDAPVDGVVPTPGLSVSTNDAIVYLKDGALYIADTVAGLGAGQILNALHTFTLRGSGDIDEKRWANGTQTFDVNEYVRSSGALEFEATYAKTTDIVGLGSESDDWMSDETVTRYARMLFTSTVMADGATPHSWDFTGPMRYYTRTETDINGNAVVVLTGHLFYEPSSFAGVFESTVVNQLDETDLGLAGS